jgi:hypothetical protein
MSGASQPPAQQLVVGGEEDDEEDDDDDEEAELALATHPRAIPITSQPIEISSDEGEPVEDVFTEGRKRRRPARRNSGKFEPVRGERTWATRTSSASSHSSAAPPPSAAANQSAVSTRNASITTIDVDAEEYDAHATEEHRLKSKSLVPAD